jgi:hypothetical protein
MLLSSIIQTFEAEFLPTYQDALLPSQRKALAALKQCRTTQSLGLLAQCDGCEKQIFIPHSCGHRNCPHCQHHESQHDSAAIFAKACFGHPSPSKRQKLRGNQCLRRPQPSCYTRCIPNKGYATWLRNDSTRSRKACIFTTQTTLRENTCTIASGD